MYFSSDTIPRKVDHHLIVLLSAQLTFILAYSLVYHAAHMLERNFETCLKICSKKLVLTYSGNVFYLDLPSHISPWIFTILNETVSLALFFCT